MDAHDHTTAFGILYLKAWLLRVLNSLFGIKCSSVFMSTRL